jgi:lipoyl(octanoyl) transferase
LALATGTTIAPSAHHLPATIELRRLDPEPYPVLRDWQRERAAAVARGEAPEVLALVEHQPVYTMGPRTDPAHLLLDEAALRATGADVCWTDRGGDVTWHGPGQLTAYPILDLRRVGRDLHAYVSALEGLLIDLLATYGVRAARAPGRPGVWVGDEKIAALGIKVARGWISYHGVALNVGPDLRWFEPIIPCGLHGYGVTSLSRLLGRPETLEGAVARFLPLFESRFSLRLEPDPGAMGSLTQPGR